MESNIQRFFTEAMDAGLRPIHLLSGSDTCPAGTWEEHVLLSPDTVCDRLTSGGNIGFLLTGKSGSHPNPLGIWGLVIESKRALDRLDTSPFGLMFAWGDPERCIMVGRLPDASGARKSRVVRGSHVVKLTGILLAPGCFIEGNPIRAYVRDEKGHDWVPWMGNPIAWRELPMVDPISFTPSTTLLIPLDEPRAEEASMRVSPEWIFWDPAVPLDWNRQGHSSAKGTLSSRKIRGDGYIRSRIKSRIVSRAEDGGRKTLLAIAVHLVKYLCLPDELAFQLLAEPVHGAAASWNSCCIGFDGAPLPWVESELRAAIAAAHEYISPFGVWEHRRFQALREGKDRLRAFMKLLHGLPKPHDDSPAMKAQDLYETFLELFSVDREDIKFRRFCLAIQSGIATEYLSIRNIRRTRKKLRYYQGVNSELIELALEAPHDETELLEAA